MSAYYRRCRRQLPREFDRIGLAAFKADSEKGGDGLRLIPWGQGFRDMAPAIDAPEIAIIERKLVHENSPLLNWNLANAVARTDPAGNRKLDKEGRVSDRWHCSSCDGHGPACEGSRSYGCLRSPSLDRLKEKAYAFRPQRRKCRIAKARQRC